MTAISSDDDQTPIPRKIYSLISRWEKISKQSHRIAPHKKKMAEVKKLLPRKQEEASFGTREGKLLGAWLLTAL